MAYRSPELYDVQVGTQLDEKMDIWVSMISLPLVMWDQDARENENDPQELQGVVWLNNEYTNAWDVYRAWDVYFMQLLMAKVPFLKPTCIK